MRNRASMSRGFKSPFGRRRSAAVALAGAAALIGGKLDGFAVDFTDTTASEYGTLIIRDTVTPANNYNGAPFTVQGGKIPHSRTGRALQLNASGLWEYAPHNLLTAKSEDLSAGSGWTYIDTDSVDVDIIRATTQAGVQTPAIRLNLSLGVGGQFVMEGEFKWRGTGTVKYVGMNDSTDAAGSSIFNLETGTVEVQHANHVCTISDAGDGYYLCRVVWSTFTDLAAVPQFFISEVNTLNRITDPDSTVDFVYARKLAVRARPSPDTYVQNTTTTPTHWPRLYRDPVTLEASGYWPEESRTNFVQWNCDLTNAVWTKTNCTAAKTATGPDGIANSASTLTATGANATALQAITVSASSRVPSTFIKRRTGSGVIQITQDNGATWTTVTVTAAWTRVEAPAASVLNPTFGFRIVTSGDAIDIAYGQLEGTSVSSPIPTTGATVSRAADIILQPETTFNHSDTAATVFVKCTAAFETAGSKEGAALGTTNTDCVYAARFSSSSLARQVYVAGPVVANATKAFTAGAAIKTACAYQLDDFEAVSDGSVDGTDTVCPYLTAGSTALGIGNALSGGAQLGSAIQQVLHVPERMSSADMQTLTGA